MRSKTEWPALINKITELFEDKNGVLTLCTAHKSKGREWPNVAILEPELMPGRARKEWQADQENNLIYVAITRAQERLIWIQTEKR
jgi:superfamily I DNA/RNA helicase